MLAGSILDFESAAEFRLPKTPALRPKHPVCFIDPFLSLCWPLASQVVLAGRPFFVEAEIARQAFQLPDSFAPLPRIFSGHFQASPWTFSVSGVLKLPQPTSKLNRLEAYACLVEVGSCQIVHGTWDDDDLSCHKECFGWGFCSFSWLTCRAALPGLECRHS